MGIIEEKRRKLFFLFPGGFYRFLCRYLEFTAFPPTRQSCLHCKVAGYRWKRTMLAGNGPRECGIVLLERIRLVFPQCKATYGSLLTASEEADRGPFKNVSI
jgi:hypothetical protein